MCNQFASRLWKDEKFCHRIKNLDTTANLVIVLLRYQNTPFSLCNLFKKNHNTIKREDFQEFQKKSTWTQRLIAKCFLASYLVFSKEKVP